MTTDTTADLLVRAANCTNRDQARKILAEVLIRESLSKSKEGYLENCH